MPDRPGAERWVPPHAGLGALAEAAHACRGCELWADATQVVFGRGDPGARLMLVGEQPGDREDREGEPFVGPAGRVLDDALEAAGIADEDVYVTNAVKHFRFEQRGKRRIHQKPDVGHVLACLPWLVAEAEVARPRVVVALGATAGRAVFGRAVRVTAERGRVLEGEDVENSPIADDGAPRLVLTTHPSSLLRLRDRGGWDEAFDALVGDLRVAADAARS